MEWLTEKISEAFSYVDVIISNNEWKENERATPK